MAHLLTYQNPLGMEGKMMLRGAGISLGAVVVLYGLAGCSSVFGPDKDDEKEGPFGIGSSTSFVTTGGASCGAQPCPSDDITFIVPDEVTHEAITQRMSFNAKGGVNATGVFNFTGKVGGVNTKLHGDIVCYSINSTTNTARVAGHITSADPAVPLGSDFDAVWTVQDNGEGSDDPDQISMYGPMTHLPLDPNANCVVAEGFVETMHPIVTGNVQIHN
jgi:hypothetical protein